MYSSSPMTHRPLGLIGFKEVGEASKIVYSLPFLKTLTALLPVSAM